jgi:predicted metalloprotease with PDZ domain
VKYYRPDENTPNATVSYYTKGALVALALDLTLRQQGRAALDVVMRWLWKRSGGGPITEADIAAGAGPGGRPAASRRTGRPGCMAPRPAPAELLATLGVRAQAERAGLAASLGLRLSEGPVSGVQVKHVLAGSAAAVAGLSAGDELLAIDGWRIRRLDEAQQWIVPGRRFDLLVARDQKLHTLSVKPDSGARPTTTLSPAAAPSKAAAALRRSWIGH